MNICFVYFQFELYIDHTWDVSIGLDLCVTSNKTGPVRATSAWTGCGVVAFD